MINAAEAFSIVLSHGLPEASTTVSLDDSLGRVLSEDIMADRDQPPFHRVSMDGIAINSAELTMNRCFKVLGTISAGTTPPTLPEGEVCYEIMTGAVLPPGADIVIRYEDLVIADNFAKITAEISDLNSNFHTKGSDYREGSIVLTQGTKIRSTHTAILASVGCSFVKVFALPRIAIMSTGDELVNVEELPAPHQIRWSNGISLKQELGAFGFSEVSIHKVKDDEITIREKMLELLNSHEVLLLTGGVSAGKFDFVPKVLKDCEVTEIFHKVAQKPGKPLWFGATENKKVVFGLPGNPVSCLVNLRKYVIPLLLHGKEESSHQSQKAILASEVKFIKDFTYYCSVKVFNEDGRLIAYPLSGNGSGDFFQLRDSDGFMELSPQDAPFAKGHIAEVFLWGQVI